MPLILLLPLNSIPKFLLIPFPPLHSLKIHFQRLMSESFNLFIRKFPRYRKNFDEESESFIDESHFGICVADYFESFEIHLHD